MTPFDAALLVVGGVAAGVINTLAGGGSLIAVPLLVLVGIPGTVANGTNRIGIGLQAVVGVWRFRAEGVSEIRRAIPLLLPIGLGSATGAAIAARVPDDIFEQAFAAIMVLLLIPMLRSAPADRNVEPALWSPAVTAIAFFLIGLYGGAIQAGVGLVLLFALRHAGFDLVRANALKMVVVAALAAVAIPVFVWEDRVEWIPAAVLSVGYAVGAALGARIAVRGGERVIRPVLAVAVVVLAGRLIGVI